MTSANWWKEYKVKLNIGLVWIQVQYTSESRTVRLSNGHLSDTFWVWRSNGPAIKWSGPMLLSGFQMVASLDRFGMNKIFFMTLISKTV